MLSQMMVLFGFFSLILVLVYWVNRAVALFDSLIADGQSAWVFLEFTALTLPNVIRLVLPISGFAAAVYATNRLSSESELVVVQSTGYSSFRLARPVLMFGLIVAALMSVLTHVLVPASSKQLADRSAEIAENITARFLTEGKFLHPADGITFYIREISAQGELKDIFLSDARDANAQTTYTARSALLVREEAGPKLVMFDGMAQIMSAGDQRLAVTSFADFAYDIGALISAGGRDGRAVRELSTAELLSPTPALMEETGGTRAGFLYEGHNRFSQPLLAVTAALVGFSALLLGGFSRFGVWRQIIGAITILIFIKLLDNAMAGLARTDARYWPLSYLSVVVGIAFVLILLWVSERPALFARLVRRRRTP